MASAIHWEPEDAASSNKSLSNMEGYTTGLGAEEGPVGGPYYGIETSLWCELVRVVSGAKELSLAML